MKKRHIGRGILILLTFFILLLVLGVTGYSEGTSGFIEPTLLNRKNVVDNMCTYVPNFSKYPFMSSGAAIAILVFGFGLAPGNPPSTLS